MDRIEVLVKWSGINARRNEEGKVHVTGRKIIRPQIYTLVRKHGITCSEQPEGSKGNTLGNV